MTPWWQAPEWGKTPAMNFPRREGKVVVLRDGKREKRPERPWEQPPYRRVRIYA